MQARFAVSFRQAAAGLFVVAAFVTPPLGEATGAQALETRRLEGASDDCPSTALRQIASRAFAHHVQGEAAAARRQVNELAKRWRAQMASTHGGGDTDAWKRKGVVVEDAVDAVRSRDTSPSVVWAALTSLLTAMYALESDQCESRSADSIG